MKTCLVAIVLVLAALPLQAASFEITPFVGARFGGDFDDIETPLISDIEIDNGSSFGATFGVGIGEDWQVELLYSRQSTDLIANGTISGEVGIDVDHLHLGGLYQFRDPLDPIRPFFSFSLGQTRFNPEGKLTSDEKFSFSLGGGMKYSFNDWLGLRLQGRWVSTEINSSDAVYCDIFVCYAVEESNFLNQTELSAGLVLRFGN